MANLLLNKQVNVWRGPSEPPTKYHLWILDDKQLRLHDGEQWQTFLDNPGLSVTANTDGTVTVSNGETYFKLAVEGSSLQITKNGRIITIASNAINTIPTDEWLEWTGTLFHKDAMPELAIATYGPVVDSSGSSSFQVPNIKVDKKGHVVGGGTQTVTIPDKVVQNPVSQTDSDEYELLLAGSSSKEREVGEVQKDPSITLEITYRGGEANKKLKTPGIETTGGVKIQGNLEVPEGFVIRGTIVGNVQGEATPKDHADKTQKYGVGSSGSDDVEAMYGHVKLRDDVPGVEPPMGFTTAGKGIAASPYMVYHALEAAKAHARNLFGTDFEMNDEGKYNIAWID